VKIWWEIKGFISGFLASPPAPLHFGEGSVLAWELWVLFVALSPDLTMRGFATHLKHVPMQVRTLPRFGEGLGMGLL